MRWDLLLLALMSATVLGIGVWMLWHYLTCPLCRWFGRKEKS